MYIGISLIVLYHSVSLVEIKWPPIINVLSSLCRIYDSCMFANAPIFTGIEQLPQFSHLHELIGLTATDSVELGHIVEPPVIRTAISILPLGWNGLPGGKNADPLKVDIIGHGLQMCTLFQAQINGNWYVFSL